MGIRSQLGRRPLITQSPYNDIAAPKETGTEEARCHETITADAIRIAPLEAAQTVQQLIRSERRRARRNAENSTGFCNTPEQFESLLYPLLQAGYEPTQKLARGVLRHPLQPRTARRPYVLAAAAQLLMISPKTSWPIVWRWMEADPTFGSELMQKVAHNYGDEERFYAGLEDAQIGELYLWLERTFPAHADTRHQRQGRASWVGPLESVSMLRDAALRNLVSRGTESGVAVLRRVVAQLPERAWLAYQLLEAEQVMRTKTWEPLSPSEVITVTELPSAVLIQSAAQLSDVLVRALRKYEAHLHGEQNPIRALWDVQGGDSRRLRPIDEDGLSDHVRLFLKRELVDSGVVVNREVEVGRVPGTRLGSRTDIKVEAISRTETGGTQNVITAVIETKGCWNAELLTAMQTQLVEDYLVKLAAPAGIYLVGWFDKPKWDPTDSRRARTPDRNLADIQTQLDAQAMAQPAAFIVRAVVLDCHAP